MTGPEQALLHAAVRNNAEWCAAMCRAHGVASHFAEQAWTAQTRTPPLDPDAVTLVPGADPAAVLARIDARNTCRVVNDPEHLLRWARAWDRGDGHQDLFRPELLDDPNTFILAAQDVQGSVIAGAVASRSEAVVGVSNVFAMDGNADAAWRTVLKAIDALLPGVPLVTYDRGDDLAAAVRAGFEEIGALRVWQLGSPADPLPG